MSTLTINTKFDKSALPRWAQNDPHIVLGCKYSLSFRVNVHDAKTEQAKRQLKLEASKFEENICGNCNGSGDIDGHTCFDCQGTGTVLTCGWGGEREGAGRKALPEPHQRLNVYLSDSEIVALKQIDPSPSQAIRKLLKS